MSISSKVLAVFVYSYVLEMSLNILYDMRIRIKRVQLETTPAATINKEHHKKFTRSTFDLIHRHTHTNNIQNITHSIHKVYTTIPVYIPTTPYTYLHTYDPLPINILYYILHTIYIYDRSVPFVRSRIFFLHPSVNVELE